MYDGNKSGNRKHKSSNGNLNEFYKSNKSSPSKKNVRNEQSLQQRETLSSRSSEEKRSSATKTRINSTHANSARTTGIKSEENLSRTRSGTPILLSPKCGNSQLEKLNNCFYRIIRQFETLENRIRNEPEEPESSIDFHRQRKRANEFAVRFSRNHLYQLKRLLTEIENSNRIESNRTRNQIDPFDLDLLKINDALCKKVTEAYRTASRGLQTYINYIAFAESADVPEKIKDLIVLIRELFLRCEYSAIASVKSPDRSHFLKRCEELVAYFEAKMATNENENPKPETNKESKEKLNACEKFSMYRRNVNWKKKTEALAKIKFGLPNKLQKSRKRGKKDDGKARETCAIYARKTRPNFGKKFVKFDAIELGENPEKVRKAGFSRRNRYSTPREFVSRDEDIETMMQTVIDDEIKNTRRTRTSSSSETDLNLTEKNSLRNALLEALQQCQTSDKKELKCTIKKLLKSTFEQSIKLEPKAPNVKMIHIKYEEPDEKPETVRKNTENDENFVQTHRKEKELEMAMAKPRLLNNIFRSKISDRSSDSITSKGKITLAIADDKLSDLLKYRKSFKAYCKNNLMYEKNGAEKPWELIARIADRLIDDSIVDISSGIESDHFLQKLYYNELLCTI